MLPEERHAGRNPQPSAALLAVPVGCCSEDTADVSVKQIDFPTARQAKQDFRRDGTKYASAQNKSLHLITGSKSIQ